MGKSLSVILMLGTFIFFCACGNNKKDTENKDSTKTTQTETKDQTTDGNTSGDKHEGETKTDQLDMEKGLPADFPSDVPQPPDSKVIGSLSSSEGTNVSFESPKTTQEIADFYKTELEKAGYKIKPDGEAVSESNAIIDWAKGEKIVSLVAVRDNTKNTCSVVITYR